jgi:hypothetical protein
MWTMAAYDLTDEQAKILREAQNLHPDPLFQSRQVMGDPAVVEAVSSAMLGTATQLNRATETLNKRKEEIRPKGLLGRLIK